MMGQCKAPQEFAGQIWYCTKKRDHEGPHESRFMSGPESLWGDDRAEEVAEQEGVESWTARRRNEGERRR